jgi:sugar transferase EpsL
MKASRTFYSSLIKPAIDRALAALALVILAPVLVAIAAAVRIQLGSPVLFAQWRPGKHGRLFRLYKFRTMSLARDAAGNLLADDQRLTRFGRFLRSASLDELPELWCVLVGQMSFVGPRPLLAEYLEHYSPDEARRHEVLPGLTGWAQVHGRNDVPWEKRLALDTWYVRHQSLGLDLKILALTLVTLVRRQGITAPGHATMPRFDSARLAAANHE